MQNDPYSLSRFLSAQAPVYDQVIRELKAGRKTSHWMWFIFPQLQGLGFSETARLYALSGLAEAHAYLAHPILGQRLRECCQILADLQGKTAQQIFASPDDLKLRSCLSLFALAAPQEWLFAELLAKYFNAVSDPRSLELLGAPGISHLGEKP